MTRAVANTSVEAYGAFVMGAELPRQQAQIVAFLRNGGATRGEIAEGTGIRLASVCGRVGELLKVGTIEEASRRPCSVTGIAAHVLKLVPAQRALFS